MLHNAPDSDAVTERIRCDALPLEYESDLDPLLDRIGDAHYVLIGEASHGTHEYYAWRAALSRRLIAERGFSFVAVEGDWPACWPVHRSVTLAGDAPADPRDALDELRHWPNWLWANQETMRFWQWLREHNAALPDEGRAGWYGLEVYPLWGSTRIIVRYLTEHRPDYVDTALHEYQNGAPLAPDDLVEDILPLLIRQTEDPTGAADYYRAMIAGGARAWNARDVMMADTFDRLLASYGPDARGIVWAHNTHVGDARATSMVDDGMLNIGQLARERYDPADVVAVGFACGYGEVVAAPRRCDPLETMTVPPPRPESVEALLLRARLRHALFVFEDDPTADWSTARRVQRAIGVVYDPDTENGNWIPTKLAERYDALCWFTRTSPVQPLGVTA